MPENIQKIIKNILRDIQVDLTDEFDQNFERQAFFSEAWQRRKSPTRPGGHILVDTGQLRRSIHSRTTDNAITFYSDLPYAAIHNEGGEIIVTTKMKKFFWHKYYEATGAFTRKKNSTTIRRRCDCNIAKATVHDGSAVEKKIVPVMTKKSQHPAFAC